jgi:hypothetical protein
MRYVGMKNNRLAVCSGTVLIIAVLAFSLFTTFATPDWIGGGQQTALAGSSDSSQEWVSLFNGKDLTGWDGDLRLWKAVDGAIRGETTAENPAKYNTFCIWRGGKLKDFELKIKFRIQNGNSGIQYRSKEFEKWRISGYQAEVVGNPGAVGFLYHEGGRGSLVNVGEIVVVEPQGAKKMIGRVADKDELIKAGYYKDKDWNEYHIIAQGNHIIQHLNGYQMIELIDNDRVTNPDDPQDRKGAAREGLLALQIHAGPPMVVEFKDILIKNLPPTYGDAFIQFSGIDLDNWLFNGDKQKSKWAVGTAKMSSENPELLTNAGGFGEMINLTAKNGDSIDIYSEKKFGDCRIELQVMVPKGSNSGIYVMGEYEIQVLDSWGRTKMGSGDMGAIYSASPPAINACKKPGEWQKYIIEVQAPKFDAGGKKTENAKLLKVELNGQVLHENVVMTGPTPGGVTGKEAPTGPLMFQGNHGPVAYRNIILKPLSE